MTKDEVIEHLCVTRSMAYRSMADYSFPCDGICKRCARLWWTFEASGRMERYIRDAVVAKLKADGYTIADGFDSETGDEKVNR